MTVTRRLSRFGDWSTLQPLCQSGFDGMRPFFAGENVGSRMDRVRRAINEIRARWDQYPAFMAELRTYMERLGVGAGQRGEEDAERIAALFASVKQWADRKDPSGTGNLDDDYSAIRLYTSEPGYRQIFGTINAAFRSVGLTGRREGPA